uniref:Uncharacterized protein n=1 Tax=uncultured Thiotrichaceae bacterium TaxID=298394 RepID=A0A6S6U5N8_9GAMM|nr:MAG: Unknown protein [uncultured Thiotrichaceae bacterium]
MLETIFYFAIVLAIVSVPCYAFYTAGISAGIKRGVQRQVLRELMLCGVIEKSDTNQQS